MASSERSIVHRADGNDVVLDCGLSEKKQHALLLQTLPSDILVHIILEYVFDPSERSHITLSHVCRSLRALVISLPTLWSTLTTRMQLKELEIRLARIGDADLTIKLLQPDSHTLGDWWAFLDIVKPLSHKWMAFVFKPGRFRAGRLFYTKLCEELANIVLPRLRYIELLFSSPFTWTRTEKDAALKLPYFYHTWSTPSLKTVVYTPIDSDGEAMALPIITTSIVLTRLELTLERHYTMYIAYPIHNILALLSRTPSLQELCFNVFGDLKTDERAPPITHVHLGSLRSLKVKCADYQPAESNLELRGLISSLQIPNLVSYCCISTLR